MKNSRLVSIALSIRPVPNLSCLTSGVRSRRRYTFHPTFRDEFGYLSDGGSGCETCVSRLRRSSYRGIFQLASGTPCFRGGERSLLWALTGIAVSC